MPSHLNDKGTINASKNLYSLRNNAKLALKSCRATERYTTVFYKGIVEFNMFPSDITNCVNVR